MTCRRCCDQGQGPYEIADVMSFRLAPRRRADVVVKTRDEGMPELAGVGADAFAPAPPDRPIGRSRVAEAAYRFAWNG